MARPEVLNGPEPSAIVVRVVVSGRESRLTPADQMSFGQLQKPAIQGFVAFRQGGILAQFGFQFISGSRVVLQQAKQLSCLGGKHMGLACQGLVGDTSVFPAAQTYVHPTQNPGFRHE